MSLTCCSNIYNPVEEALFRIHFDDGSQQDQSLRAERVMEYLRNLEPDDLVEQSIRFYKWIVLYPTTECLLLYAELLLAFFHEQGLLTFKQDVNNPIKQQNARRYLVIFTMKDHVFSKTYHSIRELRADTGKKPSQIKRLPTDGLLFKPLMDEPSSSSG